MFKKYPLIGVLLFAVPFTLWAGTSGKIAGTITDQTTGLPLAGANIIISGTMLGTAAGGDGYYVITNVSPGDYSVVVTMIGYKLTTTTKVKVFVDLTTTLDFSLQTEAIEGESVVIEATRPLVQKDITSSRTIQSGEDVQRMPVDGYDGAIETIAGVTNEDGQIHFRGGRDGEVAFLLDNTSMVDPLSGDSDNRVNTFAIQETHTMTGGMSAEYGNAQSGVVNVITKDGGSSFTGNVRFTNSNNGLSHALNNVRDFEVQENQNRLEFGIGGPAPLLNGLLPGRLTYFISGDVLDTDNRYMGQDRLYETYMGKLTYKPIPTLTVRLSGIWDTKDRGVFGNLWKQTVYEDRAYSETLLGSDGKPVLDESGNVVIVDRAGFEGWTNNGQLDTEDVGLDGIAGTGDFGEGNFRIDYEDVNGSGEWDPGEPTEDNGLLTLDPESGTYATKNFNGVLDSEDLDYNGMLNSYNMLDHLSRREENMSQYGFSWTHQLSERTFYEFKLTRLSTRDFRNVAEKINEDRDGDGRLDLGLETEYINDVDIWIDYDKDGHYDPVSEDLNGNGILDEYGTDLFTDENNNQYVDASEIGEAPREYYRKMGLSDPLSNWMPWEKIPYQGQKDNDGFYTYSAGTTWDRRAWYIDESTVNSVKFDFDSQVSETQRIRSGIDLNFKEIFRHDGTDRYGYGEKFNVNPVQGAFYIQDKMEYGGMIMNIGLRYDYFDAKWGKIPNNPMDPTWDKGEVKYGGNEDLNSNGRLDAGEDADGNGVLDQSWEADKYMIGGILEDINENGILDSGEDQNGNGMLDFPEYLVYPGEIKDPYDTKPHDFISPRFGIAYPITENDKMYFSYGRYFSAPVGASLFRNVEYDLGGGFPVIGNPRLEPEKTTSYEAGVIHAFRSQSTLELKGFFKNITGLVNSRSIYMNDRDWYAFYINSDYGTVRGFEMTYTQRPYSIGGFIFSGLTTYTFAIARNKFSDEFDGYLTEWSNGIIPSTESYTDWDQRHTMNVNIDIRTPSSLGTALGGWSVNALARYGSGMRWTPPQGQDKAAADNTAKMPATHSLDLRLAKAVALSDYSIELIMDIRNLYNRKNVVDINDEEWYAADQDGNGSPDHDPMGQYGDPTVYSRGRLVRFAVQLDF